MNTPPESAATAHAAAPDAAAAGADAALVARARELLAASADGLDGRTRSRLTQARHAALAAAAGPPGLLARLLGGFGRQRWMPAGVAVASLLVVALVVTRMPGTPGTPVHSAGNGGEEIELLADADELALAQESESDYDFYAWAVAAADADAPATAGTGA